MISTSPHGDRVRRRGSALAMLEQDRQVLTDEVTSLVEASPHRLELAECPEGGREGASDSAGCR